MRGPKTKSTLRGGAGWGPEAGLVHGWQAIPGIHVSWSGQSLRFPFGWPLGWPLGRPAGQNAGLQAGLKADLLASLSLPALQPSFGRCGR